MRTRMQRHSHLIVAAEPIGSLPDPGGSMTRAGPRHPLSSLVAGLRQKSTRSPCWSSSCSPSAPVLEWNALSGRNWGVSWTIALMANYLRRRWRREWPATPDCCDVQPNGQQPGDAGSKQSYRRFYSDKMVRARHSRSTMTAPSSHANLVC